MVKNVGYETLEVKNQRGRPCREWLDEIQEWCQSDMHTLGRMMRERAQRRSGRLSPTYGTPTSVGLRNTG